MASGNITLDPRAATPAQAFSISYFFLYFMVPVNLAFLPIRFRELGFSPLQIALVSSGMSISSLFASPIYGAQISKMTNTAPILRACSLLGLLVFCPLLFLENYWLILICYSLYLLANNGLSVVLDTQAVRRSVAGNIRFEKVRIWGSIGFVVASQLVGYFFDIWGARSVVVTSVVILTLTAISMTGWATILGQSFNSKQKLVTVAPLEVIASEEGSDPTLVDAPVDAAESPLASSAKPLLTGSARRDLPMSVWVVLGTLGLVWASHAAVYIYLSLYLRTLGWTGFELSVAWNLGVLAEIVFFATFSRIRRRWSLRSLLVMSVAVTMMRWSILAMTSQKELIFCSQILHGWSFGLLYLSGINLLHEALPDEYRARGQSWVTAWGSGGGALSGRIFFGLIAGELVSPQDFQRLFLWAVGIAGLGLILSVNLFRWSPCRETSARRLPG